MEPIDTLALLFGQYPDQVGPDAWARHTNELKRVIEIDESLRRLSMMTLPIPVPGAPLCIVEASL